MENAEKWKYKVILCRRRTVQDNDWTWRKSGNFQRIPPLWYFHGSRFLYSWVLSWGTLFHPIQLILFCFETEFAERNSFGIISVTSSRILHDTSIFRASDGARVKQNLKAIAKFSGYFRRMFDFYKCTFLCHAL